MWELLWMAIVGVSTVGKQGGWSVVENYVKNQGTKDNVVVNLKLW